MTHHPAKTPVMPRRPASVGGAGIGSLKTPQAEPRIIPMKKLKISSFIVPGTPG